MTRLPPFLALFLALAPAAVVAGDSELDMLGEQVKPTAPEKPAAAEQPKPVPEALREDLAAEADAGVRASALLQVALDRLVNAELLLVGEGTETAVALADLEAARQSLQAALVEVRRLREGADLKLWLLQNELLVSTAEPAPAEPEPVVDAAPESMPGEAFTAVVAAIQDVSFTKGKMQVLTRELESARVTTAQAGALVELFSFSRDRVDALVFLHPRVLDPENFVGLLSSLKFESDRENVRNQLGLDG